MQTLEKDLGLRWCDICQQCALEDGDFADYWPHNNLVGRYGCVDVVRVFNPAEELAAV